MFSKGDDNKSKARTGSKYQMLRVGVEITGGQIK